jgi:hypothetical protein
MAWTARNHGGGTDVGARNVAANDATDPATLGQFFAGRPGPVDHVMVTGPVPYYAPLATSTTRGRSAISTAYADHGVRPVGPELPELGSCRHPPLAFPHVG